MRLVTYEIKTALGRFQRLGVLLGERVADANFACAWHRALHGDPMPQRSADALVPSTMNAFCAGPRGCGEAGPR